MPIFVKPWTFGTTEDIYYINNFYPPTISNNIWVAKTTNASPYDPFVNFTTGNDRGINAGIYTRFLCRIKMSPAGSGINSQFFCFPKTEAHEAMNFTLPNDAKWHNIDLDLTAISRWRNYIAGVRIDPGGGAGTTVEIDSTFLLPRCAELITIVDDNLLQGEVGTSYSQTLIATNNLGKTGWEVVTGVLPTGLGLSSAGMLSGTPSFPGTSVFIIEVKYKIWSNSKEFSIEVVPEVGIVLSLIFPVIGMFLAMRRI